MGPSLRPAARDHHHPWGQGPACPAPHRETGTQRSATPLPLEGQCVALGSSQEETLGWVVEGAVGKAHEA